MELSKHVAIIGLSGAALSGMVAVVSDGYCEEPSADSCQGIKFAQIMIEALRYNIFSAIVIDLLVSKFPCVKESPSLQSFLKVAPLYLQLAAATYMWHSE